MDARNRLVLSTVLSVLAGLSPSSLFAGIGQWTTSGPDGAIVEALAAHPSNSSTVYAATVRRLYKSVDAGASWAPTGLSGGYDVVLPTADPSVVYAASVRNSFVQRSTDGGESWVFRRLPQAVGREEGLPLVSLSVDPYFPGTLYAVVAATSGTPLYRSTNGADSWEPLAHPPASGLGLTMIAVDPADSIVLYASVSNGGPSSGVYRSLDRGATWSRTPLERPAHALVGKRVPSSPWGYGDSSRFFALTSGGLYVTDDLGRSWTRLAPALQAPSHLAIAPSVPNLLYVIDDGVIFQSSDGGETVTPVSDGNFGGGRLTIAASAGSVVLIGSGRGLSRSVDAGRVWASANAGIREAFVHSVAVDPTNPAVVFAAGPGGIYGSRDGGETWNDPVTQSPDARVIAFDPSNPSTLYAAGTRGVQKSADGGRTWESTGLVDYIEDLVIDPSNPRRILAGYTSVYRTLNAGESWDRILTPEDEYSSYYGGPPTVSAIAIAPSDGATVYAGGRDGGFIYRSDDGGDHWLDLGSGIGVEAIAVDACDPRIVQAGWYGGIFRTLDGGETWQPLPLVSERFPYGVTVHALARDPRHSSSLFAGTSAGLFWSNDRGATWTRFEPALEEAVRSLALDPTGRFLQAGTERGVFSLERTFDPCRDGPDRLCLMGMKFELALSARNPRTGAAITGRAIEEGESFGYFSFPELTGDPEYPEVFVKMVDATGAPPPFGGSAWVFHSSLTDLDYTLTVRETDTGRVRTYSAGDGASLTCGRADTAAFVRACESGASLAGAPGIRLATPSGAELSLLRGRFRATLRATDPRTGRSAQGAALEKADGFGYFSFPDFTGDPSFPEVFVKMTDATALPGGYFGVFHTGLTDLEYTLSVTDQVTGAVRTYRRGSPAGTELCGEADTAAFRN